MISLALIAGGLLTAAGALALAALELRRYAREVASDVRSADPEAVLPSPLISGNPTFPTVLAALLVAGAIPQIALGIGFLPAPVWAAGGTAEKAVIAVVMGVAFVAAGTWLQSVWLRAVTTESGVSAERVRLLLHRRNPLLVSSP